MKLWELLDKFGAPIPKKHALHCSSNNGGMGKCNCGFNAIAGILNLAVMEVTSTKVNELSVLFEQYKEMDKPDSRPKKDN